MIDYVGKCLYVDKLDEKGNPSYYSGHYLCIHQSNTCIWVIGTAGRYESIHIRILPYIGKEKYDITIDCVNSGICMARFLVPDLREFARRHEGSWVETVFQDALKVAEIIDQNILSNRKEDDMNLYVVYCSKIKDKNETEDAATPVKVSHYRGLDAEKVKNAFIEENYEDIKNLGGLTKCGIVVKSIG